MTFLVFDTETNGLPKNYNGRMDDVNNWPRVIQLSFVHFNENGEPFEQFNALIKPDGWVIPNEKFWIDNGFSMDKSIAEGVAIEFALDMFITQINAATVLVAHNMAFDYNVIGAEMIRLKKRADKKIHRICTMVESTNYCKLDGKYGYKWPKLNELHRVLFGSEFDGAHDAHADVMACGRCFHELVKRDVIKIILP